MYQHPATYYTLDSLAHFLLRLQLYDVRCYQEKKKESKMKHTGVVALGISIQPREFELRTDDFCN